MPPLERWIRRSGSETKTELQIGLAAATQTTKRTAGVFLETLSALAYKRSRRPANLSFRASVIARKAEEEGAPGLQSQDATEDQDSS
jgi:hypothetical protein